jgi:hypothetical protein
MATALGPTLTTTVRVVDWVHTSSSDVRATTFPTVATSFTDHDCVMIGIANAANGCSAVTRHSTNFATWQL